MVLACEGQRKKANLSSCNVEIPRQFIAYLFPSEAPHRSCKRTEDSKAFNIMIAKLKSFPRRYSRSRDKRN
jgi:hypothetical protein